MRAIGNGASEVPANTCAVLAGPQRGVERTRAAEKSTSTHDTPRETSAVAAALLNLQRHGSA
ncbi:MAG TPA: hypothetical protein VLF15_13455, partial [Pseudoxanthomonas sp.]|nr:hypothetical protein [Pseudoxanthomonas sp.]